MKNTILKLTAVAMLATAILGTTTLAQAEDTNAVAPAKKSKSSGEKFYGPITAVDATAKTITVSDQVYTITDKTELTLAKDDSKAKFADATVGETVRGSYTKGADGKLDADKVRIGKKSGGKSGGKSGDKVKKDAGAADAATPAADK